MIAAMYIIPFLNKCTVYKRIFFGMIPGFTFVYTRMLYFNGSAE
uniref:Uncharacterized protein n=1 Tax=Anguilla anguilla TaxID=7936 RepID=A0A0E9QXR3_ANGAN